jgi:hypothetical protein
MSGASLSASHARIRVSQRRIDGSGCDRWEGGREGGKAGVRDGGRDGEKEGRRKERRLGVSPEILINNFDRAI